ncbi:Uncharacterised protein [Mycobacteroides abscessus subsp. massiliense]|nr:Uncharacterised protein [Mycobacteroides abscessus subsp. massiliense]
MGCDLGAIERGEDRVLVKVRQDRLDVVGVPRREPLPAECLGVDDECHDSGPNSTAGFRNPVGSNADLTARMAAISPGVRAMPR